MEKRIIQVEEKVPVKLLIPLSIQHMFAMFGASVLVPFMFGINPAVVHSDERCGNVCCSFLSQREKRLPIWDPASHFYPRAFWLQTSSVMNMHWADSWFSESPE